MDFSLVVRERCVESVEAAGIQDLLTHTTSNSSFTRPPLIPPSQGGKEIFNLQSSILILQSSIFAAVASLKKRTIHRLKDGVPA